MIKLTSEEDLLSLLQGQTLQHRQAIYDGLPKKNGYFKKCIQFKYTIIPILNSKPLYPGPYTSAGNQTNTLHG